MALYQKERKILHDVFNKLNFWISFTDDIWILNLKLSYISLKAHYIDFNFILQKKIIYFKKLSHPCANFAIEDCCCTSLSLINWLCWSGLGLLRVFKKLVNDFRSWFDELLDLQKKSSILKKCMKFLQQRTLRCLSQL